MSSTGLNPVINSILELSQPVKPIRSEESCNVAISLTWWWGTLWIIGSLIAIAALTIKFAIENR